MNALPKVMPKPVILKEIPGKIAISPLKSKIRPRTQRRQRIRRTKKEIERERKRTEKSKSTDPQKSPSNDAVIDTAGSKADASSVPDVKVNENDLSKQQENSRIETTEPTLPQPELSNDILASLQIPQNESNNESMSPTAAFLMTFPVVSAGVRIGEDEHETHDSQSIQHSTSNKQPASEANILENISSLLTTKDYDRFVADAVENDSVNCEVSTKPNRVKQAESCIEKSAACTSFDFQLKPIVSSCSETRTDTCLRVSVTCSSTYLPEIGNLTYKDSPSKKNRKSTNEESVPNVTTTARTTQDNFSSTTQPKTSTVSTEDYVRNHTAMDFITSSSTVLHNLEPPSLLHRLSDTIDQVKRVETTPFENFFIRNAPVSSSINTSSTYSSVYSYDKLSTTVTTTETKATVPESANYNFTAATPSIVTFTSTDSSQPKSKKIVETPKDPFAFAQSLAVSTADTAQSTKSCRENPLNSLYSYPNNTTTYSSTSLSHFTGNTNTNSANPKPYQDNTVKSSMDKTFYKPSHSTSTAVDGFYTSLTNIGTTHSNLPDYPSSIMRPNMYTSALSLSSSSNHQKALDYAPQTPFTFSLTTPVSTVSSSKNTTLAACQQSQNYLPATHPTSYQDFNPFAFDNISSISAPITPYSACRETSQFSFSLTSTTNKVTSKYPSQSSFSIDQNFLPETRMKSVIAAKSDTHLEKKVSYKPCSKVEATHATNEIKVKDAVQKVEKSNPKQHVNWMTSTTDLQKNDYPILPPPLDYTQPVPLSNQYIPQPTSQLSNSQKNTDIYFGHQIGEENFQWSPNKMIDTPSFNSTTLPNLHGDLALNNSITPKPPQVSSTERNRSIKPMQATHMGHMQLSQQSVAPPNPSNSYFSVSQLVDHPKTVGQSKSYDAMQPKTSKTNSTNQSRFKHKDSKKVAAKSSSNVSNFTPNIFVESFAYNEPQKPNNSNSYSAEALISVHPSKKEAKSLPTYGNQSDYCNQTDTFNNIDYLNDPNYNYYNNSYFPQISDSNEYFCSGSYSDQQFHNKTNRSNAPAPKLLTPIGDTAYGSHTAQNNLYSFPHPSGKLSQQSTQYKNSSQLSTSYNQNRSYPNSNKKQFKQDLFPSYDPNTSANYFTPSLNINTPIIPHPPLITTPNISANEDFAYTSHLNYPSSLSKASIYPATQQMNENNNQGSNAMLHGNVGGGGGSGSGNLVTNFNLSTICPEINDKTRQQNW